MFVVMMFIVGLLLGGVIISVYYRRKYVGTLRIDTSDPDDGAYFFLELESGKIDSIRNQKTILLTVDTKNYISQ